MSKLLIETLDEASILLGIRRPDQPPLRGGPLKLALFRIYILPFVVFGGLGLAVIAITLSSASALVRWGG